MMNAAFKIALHDLRLTFTDRAAVVWLFFLPVVFATFFGLVMGSNSDPTKARASLTIDDQDQGPVATALVTALAGEGLQLDALEDRQGEQERAPLRLLRIPVGTSAAVVAGEQVTLELSIDPDASQEATLLVQARLTGAIAQVIGRLVDLSRSKLGEPIDAQDLMAINPSTDLVTMTSTWAGRAEQPPSGFSQSVPGNVVMFVLLVALTYGAASLTRERSTGLLRRLATTPVSRAQIVAGKIGGQITVATVQITVLVAFAAVAQATLGIHIGHLPEVWVILFVYTLAVAPLGVAIGGWFRDPDRAANVGVVSTITMAALGGCWWPLEIVPQPFQAVALLFPTGWAMTGLHGVISFGRSLPEVAQSLVVLLGFAVVFTVVAARTLRLE